ncbi:MAG: thiamine phosphate synthase [Gammaproteobacteria bacterium]|jgi:thiamine-phosphate pyrophosphorylase|nr:thiamine phosphate synthase [Gammaproteobacteria bacterium]
MTTSATLAGLYVIADTSLIEAARLIDSVALAIAGGAHVIQYRDKAGDRESRLRQATALARLCENQRVPLIINDDPELAADVGAAGVHLGRTDPSVTKTRRRLGSRAIIGISCYNQLELALAAEAEGANYVAFGSFYSSTTKPKAVRAAPTLLRTAKRQLNIPVVAIGGITPENGAALINAGADSLAVIQGVFKQTDIRQAAYRYALLFSRP